MNVVLDTNVVVSGLLTPMGHCGQILDLVMDGSVRLCIDGRILGEYREVPRRPRLGIKSENVERILAVLRMGPTPKPLPVVLPDPDDLPFLEVAAADGAVLVTGNLKHFPPKSRSGVTVMPPAEFLKLLRRA